MAAFRQVFRRLSREPGFALTAIALLAVGLGANLTMFSGINGGMYM